MKISSEFNSVSHENTQKFPWKLPRNIIYASFPLRPLRKLHGNKDLALKN